MGLGDVDQPAPHRLHEEIWSLLRMHPPEVPDGHRALRKPEPDAGPRALLRRDRRRKGDAVADDDDWRSPRSPAAQRVADLGAARDERAAHPGAQPRGLTLASGGRRELVEGGQHPEAWRE